MVPVCQRVGSVDERFQAQYDAFKDVSALASDMKTLAIVQGCVTLVAEKLRILEEMEATLRSEIKEASDELSPMTEAFKQEEERENQDHRSDHRVPPMVRRRAVPEGRVTRAEGRS